MPESHEYWKEVQELAKAYGDVGYRETIWGDGQRDRDEWLWEICDAHEWVIYTAHAHEVLRISPNDTAYGDELGEPLLYENPAPGAMFAMMTDIREEAGRL